MVERTERRTERRIERERNQEREEGRGKGEKIGSLFPNSAPHLKSSSQILCKGKNNQTLPATKNGSILHRT
jgi:hypothetical protein